MGKIPDLKIEYLFQHLSDRIGTLGDALVRMSVNIYQA